MYDVVIGNAWGDEGKGLVTDWLSGPDTVVVRFCGGAQAGHTVVDPDGRRHVFQHFGSGSFRGATTFLSEFFYCDPEAFVRELRALRKVGLEPVVRVSPAASVVTPYDRLLNQLTEQARASGRHGSCGYGVGEAAARAESTDSMVRATHVTYGWLRQVWYNNWASALAYRLDALESHLLLELDRRGIEVDLSVLRQDMSAARTKFIGAVSAFMGETLEWDAGKLEGRKLVFEGSQGLLLDRDLGAFPYVTRAKTGLVNVEALLGTLADCRIWFVSRSYFTRHGAGPLPGEDPGLRHADSTNVDNPWQGSLRFAPRDGDVLLDAQARALAEVQTAPGQVRSFVSWTDVPGSEHLQTDAWSDGPTRLHCHAQS